jgi:hypothetical protein
MIETGNTANLILGSVEVVVGQGNSSDKVASDNRCKQYRGQRYHQAKVGGLVAVWKIASSREFEQHQRQRLGES